MRQKSRPFGPLFLVAWCLASGCGSEDDPKKVRTSDAGNDAARSEDARKDSAAQDADSVGPEISLSGSSEVVIDCGRSYTEPGVSASDAQDGTVSVSTSGVDQIVNTAPGRFVITYTARDKAGNTSQKQRTVYVCGPACGEIGKAAIDLSHWKVEQYEQNSQPDANWALGSGALTVTQTVNADASILLSDFDAADAAVEGMWNMPSSAGDDDFVGFVFGYQDRGHFYLFDWKGATQSDPSGPAEVGMSLKVVSLGKFGDGGTAFDAGAGPDGAPLPIQLGTADLWPTAGGPNVKVLQQGGVPLHNTIPWKFNTNYSFFLEFHPGSFRIVVKEVPPSDAGADASGDAGSGELANWSVQDDTYRSGLFGFYNYSQGPVNYTTFTRRATPGACSTVLRDQ